ncbi:uncharacterized protein LOC135372623 [Ornithodoros turicata]|uniref:uncharacterized protein LOC135372623 n=1 Tax=Ornithodoros turicata TaxID=34597 RepID=UPI003138DBD8
MDDDCNSSSGTDEESTSESSSDTGQDSAASHDHISSEPLYSNSSVTDIEACYLLFTLFMKYSLTRECLGSILLILSHILPSPNALPSTPYKFFKFLAQFKQGSGVKVHYYCKNCFHLSSCVSTGPCPCCGDQQSNPGTFLQMCVADTLKSMLEHDGLYQYIGQSSEVEHPPDMVSGMVDGELYQGSKADGNGRYNFSLFWNTDGISVFKSSPASLWPVHCIIPELPVRLQKKFQILTMLWFGTKPSMNTFLRPFCEEMLRLSREGLEWIHPVTGVKITSLITAPVSAVDAVARAMMQNVRQFNGRHGCSFCEHPGETYKLPDTRAHVHIYPADGEYRLRDGLRMLTQATQACTRGTPVKGVKGPTVLSLLRKFDIGRGFTVDYMHCVLLGVARMFLALWLDTKHHRRDWYLGSSATEIESRLMSIRPPDVTRTPRSLKHRLYWKASELRSWLLYYSIPVLSGILPELYHQHFLLLVGSMHMLLSEAVAQQELDLAEVLLSCFVSATSDLYSKQYLTFNVHQLTHLVQSVRRWGPLWATSAFLFEDRNGALLRIAKGTQAIDKQLGMLVSIGNSLAVIEKYVKKSSLTEFLLCKLHNVHFSKPVALAGEVKFHGKSTCASESIAAAVFRCLGSSGIQRIQTFKKVTIGCQTFSSQLYTRQVRRNNSVVQYAFESSVRYGIIQCFCKAGNSAFTVVQKFDIEGDPFMHTETGYVLSPLVPVRRCSATELIKLPCKMQKCVLVSNFLCVPPNKYEVNL